VPPSASNGASYIRCQTARSRAQEDPVFANDDGRRHIRADLPLVVCHSTAPSIAETRQRRRYRRSAAIDVESLSPNSIGVIDECVITHLSGLGFPDDLAVAQLTAIMSTSPAGAIIALPSSMSGHCAACHRGPSCQTP